MIEGDNSLPLAVVGCDFRVASSEWRARIILDEQEIRHMAHDLERNRVADGFADLNTCNRNEWIVSSENPRWAAELLKSQMIRRAGSGAENWLVPYAYAGEAAARHIFKVAIGQESLVVGERQIAGQLYRSLEVARKRCLSSRALNGLGSISGRLVRIALRRGCIENAAVGVHSLVIRYLKQRLGERLRGRIALIGMGRIGRRILGVMTEALQIEPVCVNRSVRIDQQQRIRPIREMPAVLSEADAAIVCTGAPGSLVRIEHLEPRPVDHPLLLIDIGIPPQVERRDLPSGIEVVGLDELVEFHRSTKDNSQTDKIDEVARLVDRALIEYRAFCNEQAFSGILDTVHNHHRQLVGEEIPRLVANRFDYLPAETQARLEGDIRNIVLEYTNEVFRTIKETSLRDAKEDACPEES
jgi:glutamyl-tRNA reductase